MLHVMFDSEDKSGRRRVEVVPHFGFGHNMNPLDPWNKPYTFCEGAWGVLLLVGIFAINISVLWVVSRSRELWKPRHLWMACLCITDLFVGAHKGLELLLLLWPKKELCVLQRATLVIPYVVNMLLLTLLSLDRFVAVRHPFFYSSFISNKHVGIGFLIVLVAGLSLAAASIGLGLQDPICHAQSLQLVYLTIVLAICSILTLFFNSAVLRIAKQQLNAIYAQEPSFKGKRRVSVACTNCGYKNETYVNTLLPVHVPCNLGGDDLLKSPFTNNLLSLANHITVLDPLDLDIKITCDPSDHHLKDDTATTPLVKALSLPTLSEIMNVPISLVVQPDPAIPPAFNIGNVTVPADPELGGKVTSMSNISDAYISEYQMPRSRSLLTCQTNRILPHSATTAAKLQFFCNLHFARAHMFHVGRLFPSIRFARTVLLIMIPMWVFILPIVTIIPLHTGCEDGNKSELNCDLVETLWQYLIIHMRSILPLQAILDTLIYASGSKEFRFALVKLMKKYKTSGGK